MGIRRQVFCFLRAKAELSVGAEDVRSGGVRDASTLEGEQQMSSKRGAGYKAGLHARGAVILISRNECVQLLLVSQKVSTCCRRAIHMSFFRFWTTSPVPNAHDAPPGDRHERQSFGPTGARSRDQVQFMCLTLESPSNRSTSPRTQ